MNKKEELAMKTLKKIALVSLLLMVVGFYFGCGSSERDDRQEFTFDVLSFYPNALEGASETDPFVIVFTKAFSQASITPSSIVVEQLSTNNGQVSKTVVNGYFSAADDRSVQFIPATGKWYSAVQYSVTITKNVRSIDNEGMAIERSYTFHVGSFNNYGSKPGKPAPMSDYPYTFPLLHANRIDCSMAVVVSFDEYLANMPNAWATLKVIGYQMVSVMTYYVTQGNSSAFFFVIPGEWLAMDGGCWQDYQFYFELNLMVRDGMDSDGEIMNPWSKTFYFPRDYAF
jgi:hypothetical protein